MTVDGLRPIQILGAGINGTAIARELVLNGLPVWMVESRDISSGATAHSSRLIHGGLRYLEYGEVSLVRESLEERGRLRKLAPHYVRPLRLAIPISNRIGGVYRSATKFLHIPQFGLQKLIPKFISTGQRGLYLVQSGLWMYDRLASSEEFPPHQTSPLTAASIPAVDPKKYSWICTYTDAQILYPERLVLAQLEDTRALAKESGVDFRLFNHCRAERRGRTVEIFQGNDLQPVATIEPSLVINATGAWGDFTLGELKVPAPRLFGGTKGSHFITWSPRLARSLGGIGVYAEAADGRLIFVLPFGPGVLVGTTDETFEDRPDNAVATERELKYLLEMVNDLFPHVGLTRADVDLHYSGVRPLPKVDAASNAAISRDYAVHVDDADGLTVLTIVGGKLTTCRSLGEAVTKNICERLKVSCGKTTRERPLPGGATYPRNDAEVREEWGRIAADVGIVSDQVAAVWSLVGNRAGQILRSLGNRLGQCLPGTHLPIAFVDWVIENEWSPLLEDLIERRLMLLYHPGLTAECIEALASRLVRAGRLAESETERAVNHGIERLQSRHGKTVLVRTASGTPR